MGNSDRKTKKPISYWRNQGVTLTNGQPLPSSLDSAGLLLPAGIKGPAFLVGKNFDAFYSYNASENYALAIAQLSDMISQNRTRNVGFVTPWPTDDAGISRRQTREIQQALLQRGYDIGEADGMIGEKSRQAIQDFQRQQGATPDGRAGMKLYQMLVGNATAAYPAITPSPATVAMPSRFDGQPREGQIRDGQTGQGTKVVTDSQGRTTYYRQDNGQGIIVSPLPRAQ